jgi:hypothetical protein
MARACSRLPSSCTAQAAPWRGRERMMMVVGSKRSTDQKPTPNLPAWLRLPSLLEAYSANR